MTLSNANSFILVQGNDVTTVFNYNFIIPAANDVALFLSDSNGNTVIISSNYTISGIGNPAGGTVTYPTIGSPIPTGSSLLITRALPLLQLTTISNQGAFYPDVVENALDYLMMCIQQVNARVTGLPIPPLQVTQIPWAVAAGSADALTATYNPPLVSTPDGTIISFRAVAYNATTVPTLNPDGLGASVITKFGGLPLVINDLGPNGEYLARFNTSGGDWELLNPRFDPVVAAASVTMKQMKVALVNAGQLVTVSNAVPADVNSSVNIAWLYGGIIVPGDILAAFIQATLSYSTGQMNALFTAAALLPP